MNWILPALGAGIGTWLLTALGAGAVFLVRQPGQIGPLLGFSAGVMTAAGFWSLLLPAAEAGGWLSVTAGFLLGGGCMLAAELLPWLAEAGEARKRTRLLLLSMTAHNIPEGLAIGVAFGAGDPAGAMSLALGIGLQNIPEGAAAALPLRSAGLSRKKSFLLGQATALTEPVAALLGAVLVGAVAGALPLCLSFAAGAMLLVCARELLPQPKTAGGFLLGFAAMTALDVGLG